MAMGWGHIPLPIPLMLRALSAVWRLCPGLVACELGESFNRKVRREEGAAGGRCS